MKALYKCMKYKYILETVFKITRTFRLIRGIGRGQSSEAVHLFGATKATCAVTYVLWQTSVDILYLALFAVLKSFSGALCPLQVVSSLKVGHRGGLLLFGRSSVN